MCDYAGEEKTPLEERRAWRRVGHSGLRSRTLKCDIYARFVFIFLYLLYSASLIQRRYYYRTKTQHPPLAVPLVPATLAEDARQLPERR